MLVMAILFKSYYNYFCGVFCVLIQKLLALSQNYIIADFYLTLQNHGRLQ